VQIDLAEHNTSTKQPKEIQDAPSKTNNTYHKLLRVAFWPTNEPRVPAMLRPALSRSAWKASLFNNARPFLKAVVYERTHTLLDLFMFTRRLKAPLSLSQNVALNYFYQRVKTTNVFASPEFLSK